MDLPKENTIENKIVKARKDHTCIECHKTIHKGQEYAFFKAYYDGIGWETFKTCSRCEKIRRLATYKYQQVYDDDGPAFGELYSWIRERRR